MTATSAPAADLVRSIADEFRIGLRGGAVRRMIVPPRVAVQDGAGSLFVSMPAVSPDFDLYINKVATIVSSSGDGATITAMVPIFAVSTGRFLGTLDGVGVTNLKCAAVTALVTDRCAAPDSRVLGVIGAGVQARQQVLGVTAVRDIREIRVHSRSAARAAAFAAEVEAQTGAAVVVCTSAADASAGVDVLSTATTSAQPLPISTELPGHVHINCMGAHTVAARELTAELLTSSALIVEDRATAIAEAGALHSAAVELDALDTPATDGYAGQRTVFSSTGCAYLDLMTCAHLVRTGRTAEQSPVAWQSR